MNSVASLVVPSLEMTDFNAPDTQKNSQHLRAARPLRHRRVKTRPTLLNRHKVKSRRVSNGLREVGNVVRLGGIRRYVRIRPGDGRVLSSSQSRNRIDE